MELNINYYFQNYQDNTLFQEFAKGITYVWELQEKKNSYLEEQIKNKNIKECKGQVLGEVTFLGNYDIGEGTKIYPNVTIEGPVSIGKNCKIMPGAYVRPGTVTGDNVVIGFNAEVKNSLIQTGAKIASLAFVGDSILGKSARIGSGVITANRRFDQKNVTVKENGQKKDTGTDFFGLILGDYSRMGANSVSSPGTFIGQYSWVFPLTSVWGFIPSEKRVNNKPEIIMTENEKTELR